MNKWLVLIITILISTLKLYGKVDSCWTVILLKKGNVLENIKPIKGKYNPKGFRLYRNCIYEIDLKDGRKIGGRLVDIKPDTLAFTNYFNQNVANKAQSKLDTFRIHYRQMDRLNLIADRAYGWYEKYSFDNFDFIF